MSSLRRVSRPISRRCIVTLVGWRSPSRAMWALATMALGAVPQLGCLSNEYRIPPAELWRQVELPPAARGQHMRVVQDLGDRRGEPVTPAAAIVSPPPAPAAPTEVPPPAGERVDDVDAYYYRGDVGVDGDVWIGGDRGGGHRGYRGGGYRGGDAGGAAHAGRSVAEGPAVAARPVRGRPASGGGGGSSGGGGFNLGGCCHGGGGGGDDWVIVAVVLVGVAAIAAIGLAASEGARFDGYARVSPDQPVHLKDVGGGESTVPLGALSPAVIANIVEARVMDDEEPGFQRLDRGALHRVGGAFRLELGSSSFNYGGANVVGPAAHIQVGAFVTRWLGFLGEIGLSGADDAGTRTLIRHSLALEVDLVPLTLGPVSFGVFGKGGVALVGAAGDPVSGGMFGGGALMEVGLTTRLALIVRAGANSARLDNNDTGGANVASNAGTITAGLSIY